MLEATAIHKHIQKAKKILIIPHQNPDDDAIGAATAMHEYITELGKPAIIFCVTPLKPRLKFIPRETPIYSDPKHFKDPEIDTIITVDGGDLRYLGIEEHVKGHPATIINIDHHSKNEYFGHINLVNPKAASTTEILFEYFRHNGIRITQKMATCLLSGLTYDTGYFTNGATTASAMKVSGELIMSGGNFNLIATNTLKNKSMGSLRLWGRAFSRLRKDEHLNLTYTYLTLEDIKEFEVSESEKDGIANFMNNIDDTAITLFLSEKPDGTVKGSFRTTRDDIDVATLAQRLTPEAGGHKKASGFSVPGTIEEVIERVLSL